MCAYDSPTPTNAHPCTPSDMTGVWKDTDTRLWRAVDARGLLLAIMVLLAGGSRGGAGGAGAHSVLQNRPVESSRAHVCVEGRRMEQQMILKEPM